MAKILLARLRVRHGKDEDRRGVILDRAEITFTTDYDSQRIFIGDGVTLGGVAAGMKLYEGNVTGPQYEDSLRSFTTIQRNDIAYDTFSTGLYAMTATNQDAAIEQKWYRNIGPSVDRASIGYNEYSRVSVNIWGVSAVHIGDAVDYNQGFLKINFLTPIRVNIDNTSIKINAEKRLYVDPNSVNWGLLPTAYNPLNPNAIWIDPVVPNRGTLRIGPL